VRRNGAGWIARCPAHEDHNPSLSVHERDGKILLHCHAGCNVEAICAALGIEMRELFIEAKQEARIAAIYDYTDEEGALLSQVVRFDPKDFRQRKPDCNDGWTWNLNGVRRVLYRLPEVPKAKSVLICEGEKDCETARSLGLTATCNPSGAGKWREEYSEFLRGKRVAIIADADEPGRKHTQQVAASLSGKTESLKVLELPDAKDLSDWVEQGGERESLIEMIRNAPEWKPTSQTTSGFFLTPLADLLARPDLPVEYVVENLLVAGTVSCVAAKPKVGKSTFARNLCLRVSRGEDFFGLKTKQGECIYLALEEREEDIKNDFRAMGADGSEPVYVHAAAAPAEGICALCDLVRERRPVLVVIDPLFRMARIRDEKAYAETYTALGPLVDVAREAGTHVMFTHHASKSPKSDAIDSPLGSTAIGGAVCSLVVLKRTETVRTVQSVQRIGQDLPETVLEFATGTHTLSLGVEKSEADVQTVAAGIQEYLQTIEGTKTEPDIGEAVEGKTGAKRKALRLLVEAGNVSREGSGRRGDPFRYRFSFSCSPDIPGTREQETEKGADTHINTGDILVPGFSPGSILVPAPTDQENGVEEGEL
jgi:nicotinamidase-related amidase